MKHPADLHYPMGHFAVFAIKYTSFKRTCFTLQKNDAHSISQFPKLSLDRWGGGEGDRSGPGKTVCESVEEICGKRDSQSGIQEERIKKDFFRNGRKHVRKTDN